MKEKYSIPCILGFVFSVVITIPVVAFAFFSLINLHKHAIYASAMKFAMASVVIGFIVSLIGVVTSKKNALKGRKLGAAGLIASVLEIVCFILFLGIVIWIGSGVQMSN